MHKSYKAKRDEILAAFTNRIEWTVSVPGALPIDRHKQGMAIEEAAQALDQLVMDVVEEALGEDVRPIDDNIPYFMGQNKVRAEIRTRLKEIMGGE